VGVVAIAGCSGTTDQGNPTGTPTQSETLTQETPTATPTEEELGQNAVDTLKDNLLIKKKT